MKVLLVGRGARDHALLWKLARSPSAPELHAAPGNPAIARLARCHDVQADDTPGLVALAQRLGIDLAIVGAEDFLVTGLATAFEQGGVRCLGPGRDAARIEGSKRFAKQLMEQVGIPTARWATFADRGAAREVVREWGVPILVKADGLAAGRGAFVCNTIEQADAAIDSLLVRSVFGESGDLVLVEEFVDGREVSAMVVTDGSEVVALPPARDFKRLGDGDTGPNTGGMAACAPWPDVTGSDAQQIVDVAIVPMLAELRRRGTPFQGLLYAGMMLTADGPVVLEYNCRFGNPETQALVRVIDADLLDLLERACGAGLSGVSAPTASGSAVALCLAAEHYPYRVAEPEPVLVRGLDAAATVPGVELFLAPHERVDGSDAVRVLGERAVTISAFADDLQRASELAYEAASHIDFPGVQLRRDIPRAALGAPTR